MKETLLHMSVNLKGLLRNTGKKSMKGFFTDDNGNELSDKDARKYVFDCIARGWRVIPMGDCPNFDYQEGCQCRNQTKAN